MSNEVLETLLREYTIEPTPELAEAIRTWRKRLASLGVGDHVRLDGGHERPDLTGNWAIVVANTDVGERSLTLTELGSDEELAARGAVLRRVISWPSALVEASRVPADAEVIVPHPEQTCPRCASWGAQPCQTASGGVAKRTHASRPVPVLLAPLPARPLDLRTLVNTRERTSPLDGQVTARIRRKASDPQPDIRITPYTLDESESVRRADVDLDDGPWADFDLTGVVAPSERFSSLDLD